MESQERTPESAPEPAWYSETEYVYIQPTQMVHVSARTNIFLPRESELMTVRNGKETKVMLRSLPKTGAWVWGPDARYLMEIPTAKSCAGGQERRPFQRASAPQSAILGRPAGPPDKRS